MTDNTERDALAQRFRDHALTTHIFGKVSADDLADLVLAWMRENRYEKREPVVVDDATEWQVLYSSPGNPSIDGYRLRSAMKFPTEEKAREFASTFADRNPVVQHRTAPRQAGPWVTAALTPDGQETGR